MLTTRALRVLLIAAAIAIFAAAATYAIHYRAQPLIDLYNFRQTQTALTSYWMIRDGWHLAYETPVGGAPWAIPFEFPIYQAIVAGISKAFRFPLDPVGRLVAFAFLTACIIPAGQLQRRLQLPKQTFWIFCCLLFSAPIYVYWGRTFMIETAAMFFSFASLPYFVDLLRGTRKTRAAVFFALWTTLSLLQKVTTGLPVFGVLGLIWLANTWRVTRSAGRLSLRGLWLDVVAFAIPLAIGYAWTEYSSYVRAENTLGAYLTNSNLFTWNWGTLQQRLSGKFWIEVLWQRLFERNLAGIVGTAILAAALLVRKLGVRRDLLSVCVLIGLLPFFTFTNLYIVHDYYPTACVIFLIAGISIAVGQWSVGEPRARTLSIVILAVFIGSGIYHFKVFYQPAARYRDRVAHVPELALAQTLKESTDKDAALLLYGLDWSSQVAYFSERRAFTVPAWPGKLDEVWANPQSFLGTSPLGAVAVCNNVETPSPQQVMGKFLSHNGFYGGEVGGCSVLISDPQSVNPAIAEGATIPDVGSCQAQMGSINRFPAGNDSKSDGLFVVNGSIKATTASEPTRSPVFIALFRNGALVRAARAIPAPPFGDDNAQRGFSALIGTSTLAGTYDLLILTEAHEGVKRCSLDKARQITLGAEK